MKFAQYGAVVALAIASSLPTSALADTYVRGHTRQDGTYVQPHYRSNPDGNRLNNYSTEGNYNPHTGKAGTVDPYKPSSNSGYGSNNLNNNNSFGSNRRW